MSDPNTVRGPCIGTDANPKFAARQKENSADRSITAPLLVVQGLEDMAILPPVTDTYVKERCAGGQQVEYWTVAGRDHLGIVMPGSPIEEPLVAWTAGFANEPEVTGCTRKSF